MENINIQQLRINLEQKKGSLNTYKDQYKNISKNIIKNKREYQRSLKAQELIQITSQEIQSKIRLLIEDIVSNALNAVFPGEYEFHLDFIIKRGKTEAEIYITYNNKRLNPMNEAGGGIVDIISFALRIALWNLQRGKKNNTIILDESFKFLSRDLQELACEILKKLSVKLKLQFILCTHSEIISQCANKIFKIKKINDTSIVSIGN